MMLWFPFLLSLCYNSAVALLLPTGNDWYGVSSVAGTDPDRPAKVNQDRAFCKTEGGIVVMGVLDGHGREGHLVTDYFQERLPRRILQQLGASAPLQEDDDETFLRQLEQQKRDIIDLGGADPERDLKCKTETGQALIDAFLLAQLDARRADGIPTGRSGTTAVVCCISEHNDRLTITTASAGDSRAFLLPLNTDGSPLEWLAPTTTTRDPSERARIERCQGRIDASGNVFYGPVGIAMTRSLGNAVMLRAGVLPVPKITTWDAPLTPNSTEFLAGCCTDGISDVFRDADALAAVVRQELDDDLSHVAHGICSRARQAWLADLPIETKVDDCTITLAKFPPRASQD